MAALGGKFPDNLSLSRSRFENNPRTLIGEREESVPSLSDQVRSWSVAGASRKSKLLQWG